MKEEVAWLCTNLAVRSGADQRCSLRTVSEQRGKSFLLNEALNERFLDLVEHFNIPS